MQRPSGAVVGLGALGLGALVAGAAAGVLAERAVVRTTFRHDPDRFEPYGQLRGEPTTVITPDGVGLHVETHDPPDFQPDVDPTIIFCHGFALNQDAFHYQRRDLAGVGRLVFWDQRSHGRSARAGTGSHTIDQLGRDLATVIDQTSPTGPVILVGHSMGGMTVMSLAAHHPELFGDRVKGVALVATSSGGMNTVSLGLPGPAAAVIHRYAKPAATAMAVGAPLVDAGRRRSTDLNQIMTKVYSFGGWSSPSMTRFVAQMNSDTPAEVLADFLPPLLEHDKAAALEAMQHVEVLVMVGTHDLLTPVEHSREIVRRVPGAEFVVLPDTGHMIITERHADVNYHLRSLIQRALRP